MASSTSDVPTSGRNLPNIYGYRDRYLLLKYCKGREKVTPERLAAFRDSLGNRSPSPEIPVCIIGAGMAGLYTAMILQDLGIPYHIVDADVQQRVGGRVFTHKFSNVPYDYYEVGAMRFADVPFMRRVFDLSDDRGLGVQRIQYIMDMPPGSRHTFLFYNNARTNNGVAAPGNPFNVANYLEGPQLATPENVHQRIREVLQPSRNLFRAGPGGAPDIALAINNLYALTNGRSMRAYMSEEFDMSDKQISWCETLDKSTGWYDRALAENILESLAFNWPIAPLPDPEPPVPDIEPPGPDPDLRWFCFDGGSSTLPQAMFNSLPEFVRDDTQFESPVTAIIHNADNTMGISINDELDPRIYSAVFSTVPLPRLSLMDLTGVNINNNYAQWSAIRELKYTPAIKIGIKFNEPWWETLPLNPPQPIRGGRSHTDLPIRMIVYPSYPQAPAPISNVLIASFSWTQDAERMGALMNGGVMTPELFRMVFRNLAAVHDVEVAWLLERYVDHFAWDWQHNPFTMGAFALFTPGVYEHGDIFYEVIRPAAGGKLFFAGEATSSCHGWVVGALNSAWRAVDHYLALNHPPVLRELFWNNWGTTEYWDDNEVELNHELTDQFLVGG